MAVALVVAAGRGERLGSPGPKAFVVVGGRPMLEWTLDALRAARRSTRSSSRCPRASPRRAGCIGVAGGAERSHSVRNALAAASRGDPVLVHDAARPLLTPELVARCLDGARAASTPRSPPRRVTDTVKEADGRPRRAHARPLAPVGGPDAAGLPPRRRSSGRSPSPTTCWPPPPTTPRSSRRSAARCASSVRRPRTSRSRPRTTCGSPSCCSPVLTDYHVHLRPDDRRHRLRALLHRRQRRALPRARRPSAGIAELGVTEHVYRFTAGARRLGPRALASSTRVDDLDRYCEFVRERDRPPARASRPTSSPAARTAWRALLEARDWDYVVGSIHFLGEGALDYAKYDVWNSGRLAPTRSGARTSPGSARRRRAGCSTCSPTPTSSSTGASERPWPEQGPALLLRHRDGADRRVGHRDRGLDRRAAQAGRRALPGAARSSRWSSTPATRSCCQLRRPHARAPRLRVRAGARAARRPRRHASSRVFERRASVRAGADRMSVRTGIGWDSHRLVDGPPADPRRRRASSTTAASTATPTPTSSPTRSSTRCSAPPASATSASTSPTPTSASQDADSIALLRESSCAALAPPAGRSSTSTRRS